MGHGKEVYRYIKNADCAVTTHIEREDGTYTADPEEVHCLIRDAWRPVYNLYADHEPPSFADFWEEYKNEIMEARRACAIPEITGLRLFHQARKRRVDAVGGVDAWRTREVRSLCYAKLFTAIEKGARWPGIFQHGVVVLLDKGEGASPIKKRPVLLLIVMYALWSGLRFADLQEWALRVLPRELSGGIKGRSAADTIWPAALATAAAHLGFGHIAHALLDREKCFDRLLAGTALHVAISVSGRRRGGCRSTETFLPEVGARI